MFLVQDQEVLRAQQLRQKPRRPGVEVWLGRDIHRLYGATIVVQHRVLIGKGPQHAVRGFASALGIITEQVVQPAAGMGVDQGQRGLFLLQGLYQRNQQAVLDHIGAVARMEGMAIIHGDCSS